MEHAPVPSWGWGQTPPFQPQPWDDPEAAERGGARYAQRQSTTAAPEDPPATPSP
jgi:hypothetical protein